MWKDEDVKIFPETIKDEDLMKAREAGRAGEYMLNLGWEKNYICYPIYGESPEGKRRR